MTSKLDITGLIKYFSDKDPKIASNLKKLAGTDTSVQTKSNKKNLKIEASQVAKALIKIADTLDEKNPTLAKEADRLLNELIKQAQMNPFMNVDPQAFQMPFGNQMEEDDISNDFEPSNEELEQDMELSEPASVEEMEEIEEDLEADLERQLEEQPDFDEVGLQEFKDKIDNLTFRLTDRDRKSRWQDSLDQAERAVKHFNRGKELLEKAYESLDKGGDRIRFRTGYKWD